VTDRTRGLRKQRQRDRERREVVTTGPVELALSFVRSAIDHGEITEKESLDKQALADFVTRLMASYRFPAAANLCHAVPPLGSHAGISLLKWTQGPT
jgi:hypothetical protein